MGRILYPRENPEGSGAGGNDGCCRRAYVNAAGSAQVFHGGDPGTRYLALAAELDHGSNQVWIGIFCQEDPLCAGYRQFYDFSGPYMRVMRDLRRQQRPPEALMPLLR